VGAFRRQVAESVAAFWLVSRNANLRHLQLSLASSDIGHWAYVVAVSVFAYHTAGAKAVGLIWIVRMVPAAVVSPLSATLADRYRRERVMIASDLLRAALITAAAASVWLHGPPAIVFVLAIFVSLAATPFGPASRALTPSLVATPNELTAANVTSSTIESVGFFAGPALGGVLVGVAGTAPTFLVTAALAAASAGLISRIKAPTWVRQHADVGGIVAEAAAGFRLVVSDSRLRLLIALLTATTLVDGALEVLIVVLAIDSLAIGNAGVGYLNAAFGLGALLGALVAIRLVGVRRLTIPFLVGVLLWGAPLIVIGLHTTTALAFVLLGLVGLGNTLADVSSSTLVQRAVPEELLSRVFGIMQFLWLAGLGVGAVLAAPLISWLGVGGAFIASGCFLPVLVAVLARRLVRIDAEATAPDTTPLGLLASIPMFGALPGEVLEQLTAALRPVEFPAGAEIIRQGESGQHLFVIGEGEVDVMSDGKPVATLRAGDYVGEISLLRDVPTTATVSARTRVGAYALSRSDFLTVVTGHETSARAADAVASARLAGIRRRRPIGITGI
jgi:MFS family permease